MPNAGEVWHVKYSWGQAWHMYVELVRENGGIVFVLMFNDQRKRQMDIQ